VGALAGETAICEFMTGTDFASPDRISERGILPSCQN